MFSSLWNAIKVPSAHVSLNDAPVTQLTRDFNSLQLEDLSIPGSFSPDPLTVSFKPSSASISALPVHRIFEARLLQFLKSANCSSVALAALHQQLLKSPNFSVSPIPKVFEGPLLQCPKSPDN
jgi:hypothetical protein